MNLGLKVEDANNSPSSRGIGGFGKNLIYLDFQQANNYVVILAAGIETPLEVKFYLRYSQAARGKIFTSVKVDASKPFSVLFSYGLPCLKGIG